VCAQPRSPNDGYFAVGALMRHVGHTASYPPARHIRSTCRGLTLINAPTAYALGPWAP
jgi:hypothetical protein